LYKNKEREFRKLTVTKFDLFRVWDLKSYAVIVQCIKYIKLYSCVICV